MKTIRASSGRTVRGSAFVISLIVISAIAAIGTALVAITLSQQKLTFASSEREIALTMADSGLDQTIFSMNAWTASLYSGGSGFPVAGSSGASSANFSTQQPYASTSGNMGSDGSFAVSISPTFDGSTQIYTLRATGVYNGISRGIEIVVDAVSDPFFTYAAFSDKTIVLNSNAYADSYDSALGAYDVQITGNYSGQAYAGTNGDIGSNDSDLLNSNVKVFGDCRPGPGGAVVTDSNAYVQGTTAALPEEMEFPAIVLPAADALAAVALTIPNNDDVTLAAGDYHYSNLQLNTNSTLTVVGPATLVLEEFSSGSNTSISINGTNGPVNIFIKGKFDMNSNTVISSTTQKPQDLRFWITTDNYTGYEDTPGGNPALPVNIDSNASLFATVYAPNAALNLDSNGHVYGSVMAKKITWASNAGIHYDEALGRLGGLTPPRYKRLEWKEITVPQ